MTTVALTTAITRRDGLINQRDRLNSVVAGVDARRKVHAFAAATGDAAAATALAAIDAEETQARTDLRNLGLALTEAERLVVEARKRSTAENDRLAAEAHSNAVDDLLMIDDEIDEMAEQMRALFAAREQHVRANKLKDTASQRAIAGAIEAYFSQWTGESTSYTAITRLADWDGRRFGRISPANEVRGPRPLTSWEAAMKSVASDRKMSMRS